MTKWLLRVLQDDPSVEVHWEWPARCEGWRQQVMTEFEEGRLWRLDRDWRPCRVDGRRYDLRSGEPGFEDQLLLKRWMIKTTDMEFHNRFKTKVCTQDHERKTIEGRDTERSAYYPWKLCVAVSRFWKQQLFPATWLKDLHLAENFHVSDETFLRQSLGAKEFVNDLDYLKTLEYDSFPAGDAVHDDDAFKSRSTACQWRRVGHERWQRSTPLRSWRASPALEELLGATLHLQSPRRSKLNGMPDYVISTKLQAIPPIGTLHVFFELLAKNHGRSMHA